MASTNINRVVVSGNLTQEPDLRNTGNGTSVCELRLANNVPIKRNDKWETKANFFQINCWGKQGENVAKYLQKGNSIIVDGHLEWQRWEDKDGKSQSRVVIVAQTVQFPPKPKAAPQGSGSSKSPAPAEPLPIDADANGDADASAIKDDDEIPF